MRSGRRTVIPAILLFLVVASSAGADDAAPVMQTSSWAPRVGELLAVRLPGEIVDAAGTEAVRVIVRSRGEQALIRPATAEGPGPRVWRFTPRHAGTCVITVNVEPSRTGRGGRTLRYEKLFLRVAPRDRSARGPERPSASATARFGHRLELAPMVDPTCLRVGADLPVRVKFEGGNLTGATVVARCEPATNPTDDAPRREANESIPAGEQATARAKTVRLTTNESATVNVRIDRAGLWTVTIEHRPERGEGNRFVATMMFRVREADTEETTKAGDPPQGRPRR